MTVSSPKVSHPPLPTFSIYDKLSGSSQIGIRTTDSYASEISDTEALLGNLHTRAHTNTY